MSRYSRVGVVSLSIRKFFQHNTTIVLASGCRDSWVRMQAGERIKNAEITAPWAEFAQFMVSGRLILRAFLAQDWDYMAALRIKREWFDAQHRAELKGAVEVREQRAAARRLPFEVLAQHRGIDTHEQEIALSGEMLFRGLNRLRCGREMDEAVVAINR
jgi:hypothetical protein